MADDGPERTPDGRFVIIDGRRWRASDPQLPDALRAELVAELMTARRAVGVAIDDPARQAARDRVQDAKVALGERGTPWWEPADEEAQRLRIVAAIRTLLQHRDDKTICPSDAARVAGGEHWRRLVPLARDAAYALADDGVLEVRQRGERVDGRTARGPIRLARGEHFPR